MITIPKIAFLGILEGLVVLAIGLAIVLIRMHRLTATASKTSQDDAATDDNGIEPLHQRIRELEEALEKARAVGSPAVESTDADVLEQLRDRTRALGVAVAAAVEAGVEAAGETPEFDALKRSYDDLRSVLDGKIVEEAAASDGTEASDVGMSDTAPQGPDGGGDAPEQGVETPDGGDDGDETTVGGPGDGDDPPESSTPGAGSIPASVAEATDGQIAVLREQQGALNVVLGGIADDKKAEVVRVVHDRMTDVIEALERENLRLRRIVATDVGTGRDPDTERELEAARRQNAELQEKLKTAEEEMENLEREYDILYSKTASGETDT